MSLAHKIAEFACNLSYEDLTPEAIHEVKRRLIDSCGCAMGAWLSEPVKIARQMAALSSSDIGATVIGTPIRGSSSGCSRLAFRCCAPTCRAL